MKHYSVLILLYFLLQNTNALYAQQGLMTGLPTLLPAAQHTSMMGLKPNLLSVYLGSRVQWISIPQAPFSINFHASMPLDYYKVAFGIGVERSVTGLLTTSSISGLGCKFFTISNYQFRVGFGAKAQQVGLNGTAIRTPDGQYSGAFTHNDNTLPITQISKFGIDAEASLGFVSKRGFVSISTKNILSTNYNFIGIGGESTFKNSRMLSLVSAYRWACNSSLTVEPNVSLSTNFVATQSLIGATFYFLNNIYAGVAFRGYDNVSNSGVAANFGLTFDNNLRIAYQIESAAVGLRTRLGFSHEVGLVYDIQSVVRLRQPKIIYNHRYL